MARPRRLSVSAAALAALALAGLVVTMPARADRSPEPAIVVEHPSGIVVHAEAPDQTWFPASLTKLMALYLAFEALGRGTLDADAALDISRTAAGQPATRLGLKAGATISAGDAITAVATVSANDAAVVLAERLAGSEAAFAERMTARARALGMSRTTFHNATGLPDERQVSTARDMALLGRALLLDFPEHAEVFSRRNVVFGGRTRNAHNRLLSSYAGTDGLKTGFTCASGFNIVATAEREGRRLLGVVLGGSSRHTRDARMKALMDAAFGDAPAAAGPRIDERPGTAPAAGAAPVRLAGDACARFARARPLRPGNLPGWGLLFGVYTERGAGRTVLREAGKAVRKIAGSGIPVLLERKLARGTSYKALLVGFKQEAAGKACKSLWELGRTCVVQPPATMNARGYELR